MSNVLTALSGILASSENKLSVIEIGTGWGSDLHEINSSNLFRLVSIDPMYSWVPDVKPDEVFDSALIDGNKIKEWEKNSSLLCNTECHLIVAKSWDAATNPDNFSILFGANVLIIDGCHHPSSAVEADYWAFRPFMTDRHTVLFDDINHGDPGIAFEEVKKKLESNGELLDSSDEGGYLGRIEVLVKY